MAASSGAQAESLPPPKSISLSPQHLALRGWEGHSPRRVWKRSLFSILPSPLLFPSPTEAMACGQHPGRTSPPPMWWGSSCGVSGMSGHKKAARPNALGGGLPALSRGVLAQGMAEVIWWSILRLPGWSWLVTCSDPSGPSQSVSPWPLFCGSHGWHEQLYQGMGLWKGEGQRAWVGFRDFSWSPHILFSFKPSPIFTLTCLLQGPWDLK